MAGTVAYEADGGVATLTLDRPDRLNTITPELAGDVREALEPELEQPRLVLHCRIGRGAR